MAQLINLRGDFVNKKGQSPVRVILITLVIVAFLFAGVIFYASKKITPEEVRRIAVESLQKAFPGAEVSLGKIDYRLGTAIKFNIAELSLKLKKRKTGNELMSISSLDLRVPVWSIITGGGVITLSINKPEFSYSEFSKDSSNWKKALGANKVSDVSKVQAEVKTKDKKKSLGNSKGKQKDKVTIPAFLTASKINMRLENTVVNYKLLNGTSGTVDIDRFLIKDLNLQASTAFELATNINLKNADGSAISFKSLVIGQIDLKEFIEQKDLSSSMVVTIQDLKVPGIPSSVPMIKTNLKFVLKKNGNILLEQSTKVSNILTASNKVKVSGGAVEISAIDVDLFLKEAVDLLGDEMAKQLSTINLSNATLDLNGAVSITKKGTIIPKLNFKIGPQIELSPVSGMNIVTNIRGTVNNKKVEAEVINKMFGGHVTILGNTLLDLKSSKVGPFYIELNAANMTIPKAFIKSTLYSEKSQSAPAPKKKDQIVGKKGSKKETSKHSKAPKLPGVTAKIALTNIKIGNEILAGKTSIYVKNNEIGSKNFSFRFSKGTGKISFLTKLLADSAFNSKLTFDLNHLNLDSLNPFLPPMLDGVRGDCSGKVKGVVALEPIKGKLAYSFDVGITAKNGELQGLNLKDHIKGVLTSVSVLKKVGDKMSKDLKVSDEFEILKLNGKFKHNHYKIKKFKFVGLRNYVSANGHGNIYPLNLKKKGVFDMVVTMNGEPVAGMMKKNVGTKNLPIRLKGIQFGLMPDYGYTTKKLAKSAMKTHGKRQIKKLLKKKLGGKGAEGDVMEKLKNNKNVKKLFKGLF